MNKDLDTLIAYIAEHFTFDEETYPELRGASEEERLAFAIRHSALHMSKTAGKIAAVSEDVDHGRELDMESLRENTMKSLINTLRLAELVGMSGNDLVQAIEKKYKKKDV